MMGGNGSRLQVTAYMVNDGNSGNNYSVMLHTASGTITAAALDISATSDSKSYDGTTGSSATPTVGTGQLKNSDTVTGLIQAFVSKNVMGANGSTLQVTAYTVNDSNSGGNYQVTLHTATGTITPATVTASIVGNPTKTYDGNTNATLTAANFSLTGVVMGESITVTKTAGTYNTKDVLTANTITTSLASGDFSPGTLTLLTNYTLPTTASGPGHITPKAATWTTNPNSKLFGASDPNPLTTGSGSGFLAAEGPLITATYTRVTGEGASPPTYHITATLSPAGVLSNYTVTNNGAEFSITHWTITGFYQPVDMNGVTNTVKGGSTVPLKFNIYAGGVEKTSVSDVMYGTVQVAEYTCGGSTDVPLEEVSNTGNTALRYDTTGHQFIQNWQTPKPANKCYVVRMTAADGSYIQAYFKTK